MFPSDISKEDINKLPLDKYNGEIVLIDKTEDVAAAMNEISQYEYVGIDTETKPVFVKGQYNHVSLIQIAIPNKVFLIRLHKTGLTDELITFFENKSIKKFGVALADDIKDLQKLKRFKDEEFFELNHLVKSIGIESNGLKKLVAIILGYRISKSAQVSNWESPELTEKQLRYGATDAFVCLEMFEKLKSLNFLN
jgi:ribonuclease D